MTSRAARSAIAAVLVVACAREAAAKETVAQCTDAAESGQRLRASGHLRAAAKQLATCTAPECPAVVRRHCAKWREELADTIPSIVVRVVDAKGNDVQAGRILFDDEVLAEAVDGRALAVDPGAHRVAWVQGNDRLEQQIVVREGERNRSVVLAAAPPDGASASPPAPAPASSAAAAARPVDAPPPAAEPAKRSPWPWIVGGAGVVAGLAGGAFWYAGVRSHDDLEGSCAPTSSCDAADVSHAKTQLAAGDVLVGVAAVAITTAVIWLVLDHPSHAASRASR